MQLQTDERANHRGGSAITAACVKLSPTTDMLQLVPSAHMCAGPSIVVGLDFLM